MTTGIIYTYKDFQTGRRRWTRGKFTGWQQGGILNARFAVFQTRRSTLFVPEYCLMPETKQAISPDTNRRANQPAV